MSYFLWLYINICLSAHRVIDEKIAIDRHFTEAELQEYYQFDPDESITDEQNTSDDQQSSSRGGQMRPSGVTMRLDPPRVCVNFLFKSSKYLLTGPSPGESIFIARKLRC